VAKFISEEISSSWFCDKDSKLMRTRHVLAADDTTVHLEPYPQKFTEQLLHKTGVSKLICTHTTASFDATLPSTV
jgi:hypothetical protein